MDCSGSGPNNTVPRGLMTVVCGADSSGEVLSSVEKIFVMLDDKTRPNFLLVESFLTIFLICSDILIFYLIPRLSESISSIPP